MDSAAATERRANEKGIACPIFWRQTGDSLTLFFVVVPWVLVAVKASLILMAGTDWQETLSDNTSVACHFMALLYNGGAGRAGFFLLLPAMAWGLVAFFATRLGATNGWRWLACAAAGWIGLFLLFT